MRPAGKIFEMRRSRGPLSCVSVQVFYIRGFLWPPIFLAGYTARLSERVDGVLQECGAAFFLSLDKVGHVLTLQREFMCSACVRGV